VTPYVVTDNIPLYPGHATVLGVGARPYQNFSALMTGINPVPGPRMGEVNQLYLRYFLRGDTEAAFQHFSLTGEDNNHIGVSGLSEGQWSEVTLNFTRTGVLIVTTEAVAAACADKGSCKSDPQKPASGNPNPESV